VLQPGGALQAPSAVVHTSSAAQLLVEAHGAPPAPLEPPAAPPAPLPPAPLEPPPPLGSSGHRIIQTGRPEASGSQTKTVRPTAHAMAAVAMLDEFQGRGLGVSWTLHDKRSAYIGSFAR